MVNKRGLFFTCILSVFIFAASVLQAAPFLKPNSLINIPTAKPFSVGEVSLLAAHNNKDSQFDFALNGAITDRVKLGITGLNSESLLTHLHGNFVELNFDSYKLSVGAGILYLSSDDQVSAYEGYSVSQNINMSSYVTAMLDFKWLDVYFGMGQRQFNNASDGDDHALSSLRSLRGVFGGAEFSLWRFDMMGEFDGSDLNLGLTYQVDDEFSVFFSGNQLLSSADSGEVANSTNSMSFSFGLKYVGSLFTDYKKRVGELSHGVKEMDQKSKEFVDQYESLVRHLDQLESKSGSDSAMDKVSKDLYARSETYIRKGKFNKAIHLLDKATELNPNSPELYVQKASCYYYLGNKELAKKNFENALYLDPFNDDVWSLPDTVFQDMNLSFPSSVTVTDAQFKAVHKNMESYKNELESRASISYDAEEFEESVDHYLKLMTVDMLNLNYYFGLADVMIEVEEYEQGLALLEEAKLYYPENDDLAGYIADMREYLREGIEILDTEE